MLARLVSVACLWSLLASNGAVGEVVTSSQSAPAPLRMVYYVNPNTGSDSPRGNTWIPPAQSPTIPFRTIGAALTSAREFRSARPHSSGVTIRAAAGTYPPLVLGPRDSGAPNGSEVRIEGEPGALITGGVTLPAGEFQTLLPSDPIASRIPQASHASTRWINISGLVSMESSGASTVSGALSISCSTVGALTLATWPSNGSWADVGTPVGASGFVYPQDVPLPTNPRNLWLTGFFVFDWFDSRIPVTSVVPSNRTLFASTTAATYVNKNGHFNADARFRFLNMPEFMDRPGMFWLDGETGLLYVNFDSAGVSDCTVTAASTALNISGASDISISGFTIESAQDRVVYISSSSRVSLDNCTVQYGLTGVEVSGGMQVTVSNVVARFFGSTAITINGGARDTLAPGLHVVTNCTIHDYGRVQRCYRPGIKILGVDNSASNNEIFNAPHQGILVGGNNHRIEYNVFHDLLLDSFDSGAIYKSDRDWTARGLVMDSNFFYNLGSTLPSDR